MLENVRSPVPSEMVTNARRNVSECFPDLTDITSCTSEQRSKELNHNIAVN